MAGRDEVLLAALAAYGLALALVFVNRSHPYNLYHASVPFAVLLTTLVFHFSQKLEGLPPRSSLPGVVAGGLVWLLLSKAQFLHYPGLIRACFGSVSRGGFQLMTDPPDVTGLPPESAEFVAEFKSVVSTVKELAPGAEPVAFLDFSETALACAANVKPWSRYPSCFHMALTTQMLENLRLDLTRHPPRYVVIRGQNQTRPHEWDFVWKPLYDVVRADFVLRRTVGSFEIWASRTP